jgi:UDP-N-acetylmuramoyl-L-alanyl-D-glutamate--2,6-diaminopimelate ligase
VRLADLAAGVPGARVLAGSDQEVARVVHDSRRAGAGDVFVAVRGHHVDGHRFVAQAAARGAACAVEHEAALPEGAAGLRVENGRQALAELAAEVEGRPARRLLVAGVTGTDGKTTVTHLAAHVLSAAGLPAGFVSTVATDSGDGGSANASGLTSREAPETQAILAGMVRSGRRAAVIEASSHALAQARVAACDFDVVGFTYIGRDHLGYHRTWEEYADTKAGLIDLCRQAADKGVPKTAVLNRDDGAYGLLAERPIARRCCYTLEPDRGGCLRAVDLDPEPDGTRFRLVEGSREAAARLPLPARFNVGNALCAAGICLALGVELDAIAEGLRTFPGVPGRLEQVDLGQPFRVYIDYAHASGSLASSLAALRKVTGGRLLAVFGCSARSDGHDPAGMGRAAAEGADWFCITTDDPVDTDPAELARQVESGALATGREDGYEVEPRRRLAIRRALGLARDGDAVLLAGKGHERTMVVSSGRREPWDERGEAVVALRELGWGA